MERFHIKIWISSTSLKIQWSRDTSPALSQGKHLLELRSNCPLSLGQHSLACYSPHYSLLRFGHWHLTQLHIIFLKACCFPHLCYMSCAYGHVSLWHLTALQRIFISINSCNSYHNVMKKVALFSLFYKLESWPLEKGRLSERSIVLI